MRRLWLSLTVFAVLGAAGLLLPSASHAEPYKWCAQYGGSRGGGGRNCGFVTYEQCMQTIRGMGGFCEHNLFYTGPEERPVRRSRKHHDD
jgi:hypothetical protein